jgi:spermidine synthase
VVVPWKLLDSALVGDGGELRLYQRGDEFSIRIRGEELMNSRVYSRTDALSELGCARVRTRKKARVLIGGLGMGYALATALANLERDAEVVIAELMPAVVEWNRSVFGHLAGHPLRDKRVTLLQADVAKALKEHQNAYDAILLDVDNGPEGLTQTSNDWLYSREGLGCARAALRAKSTLGFWSAGPNRGFVRRLHGAGFKVEEIPVTSRDGGRGARHVLWLATQARS